MPTHRDYPWERDQRRLLEATRADRGRPQAALRTPRRRRGLPSAVLVVAAIACVAYGALSLGEAPPPLPPPVPQSASIPPPVKSIVREPLARRAAPAPRSWRVTGLDSRFASAGVVEVWGSTTAPTGATITVYARRDEGARRLVLGEAPVDRGRFLTRARVPRPLRGGGLLIEARAR